MQEVITAFTSLYSKSCLCRKDLLVFPTEWISAAVTLHTLTRETAFFISGCCTGYHEFFLVFSQYLLTVSVVSYNLYSTRYWKHWEWRVCPDTQGIMEHFFSDVYLTTSKFMLNKRLHGIMTVLPITYSDWYVKISRIPVSTINVIPNG